MSIELTINQQEIIEQAIQAGMVKSVDEFIHSAIGALSGEHGKFNREKARVAGERIRELRRGITLDLKGMSVRELAHLGHKY
ncbi:MAG TPA: hypothetical protein VGD64_14490 [Acidisarcina sp.]